MLSISRGDSLIWLVRFVKGIQIQERKAALIIFDSTFCTIIWFKKQRPIHNVAVKVKDTILWEDYAILFKEIRKHLLSGKRYCISRIQS